MEIRPAQNYSEYCQAAELHKQYIPSGFLSSLGSGFLTRMYSCIATDESSALIVVMEEGTVVGFITGTVNVSRFYQRFIRKNILRGFLLIPRLLTRERLQKMTETLVYPGRHKKLHLPDAEILSMVVDQTHQGKGISTLLFEQLISFYRQHNVSETKFIIGNTLLSSIHFFEKMGAVKGEQIEMHKGSRSWVMRYRIG